MKIANIVVPKSWFIFFNKDKIKFAALGSKLATGSSANNNNGFLIIALAIPTFVFDLQIIHQICYKIFQVNQLFLEILKL